MAASGGLVDVYLEFGPLPAAKGPKVRRYVHVTAKTILGVLVHVAYSQIFEIVVFLLQ